MNTLPVPCRSIPRAVLFVWWGVVNAVWIVVFYPHPLACEKDHIAPQLCQKEKDTEEKWGSVCSRFKA